MLAELSAIWKGLVISHSRPTDNWQHTVQGRWIYSQRNLPLSTQVDFAWNNAADTILTEGDQGNKAIKPHRWQFYKQVLNYLIGEINVLDQHDMEQRVERKQLQQLGRVEIHSGLSRVLIFRLTHLWCDGSGEQMLPFSGFLRGGPAGPWRPEPWRESGLIAEGMRGRTESISVVAALCHPPSAYQKLICS